MGSTQKSRTAYTQSPVGLLQIQVLSLSIDEKNPLFKNQQSTLILNISNQQYKIKSSQIKQKKNVFKCFINSCYKEYGRMLCVKLENMGKSNRSIYATAFGLVDINQFIRQHDSSQYVQCMINLSTVSVAHLNMRINFHKVPFYKLNILLNKFHYQNTIYKEKHCFCKVTAGQQVFQSQLQSDLIKKKTKNPQLQFCIPKGLKQINIQIFCKKSKDQDQLIGEGFLSLDNKFQFQNRNQTINIFNNEVQCGTIDIFILNYRKSQIEQSDKIQYSKGQLQSKISTKSVKSHKNEQLKCQASTKSVNSHKNEQLKCQRSSRMICSQRHLSILHNITNINSISQKQSSKQQIQRTSQKSLKQTSLKVIKQELKANDFIKQNLQNEEINDEEIADEQTSMRDIQSKQNHVEEKIVLPNFSQRNIINSNRSINKRSSIQLNHFFNQDNGITQL